MDDCSGLCTSWKTADSHLTVEPLTTEHRYTSIIDGYLHQLSHLDMKVLLPNTEILYFIVLVFILFYSFIFCHISNALI